MMTTTPSPFRTDITGACCIVTRSNHEWHLRPELPSEASGHSWFRFLVGLEATPEPLTAYVHWPTHRPQAVSDYNNNDSFATALDRCCFIDSGDGRWHRIDDTRLIDNGVEIVLPPGGCDRRLAIGMPVTGDDLERLLALADQHPDSQTQVIGHASRGSPVHAIRIGGGVNAKGTMVVQSLVHAQEWAGLRVLTSLVQELLSPAGESLRQRWRWLCYPATNADGLYLGWRGDPHVVDNINPNRDWGVGRLPEISAVAADLTQQLVDSPPLQHAIDLHMGWNWRDESGAAVATGVSGHYPPTVIERQQAFAAALFAATDFCDSIWPSTRSDRPNTSAWIQQRFPEATAQAIEVSRHAWLDRQTGLWRRPQEADEMNLGIAIAHTLDHMHHHVGAAQ